MSKAEFTADHQVAFKASLARAAGSLVDNNDVTIDMIEKIEYGMWMSHVTHMNESYGKLDYV